MTDSRLQAALRYMGAHVVRTVANAEIAAAAEVSVPHLFKLFRRAYGISPQVVMRRLRVDEADRLIRENPSLSQAEVARRVGFKRSWSLKKAKQAMQATQVK